MKRLIVFIVLLLFTLVMQANTFVQLKDLHILRNSSIKRIKQDSCGRIMIYSRAGLFSYNGHTLDYLSNIDIDNIAEDQLTCISNNGETYRATGHGLFCSINGGEEKEIMLDGRYGQPVTSAFKDRDDNIWIGTYYNGVFFKGAESGNINRVKVPEKMKNIRSLISDSNGCIWSLTDNNGIYRYDITDGEWQEIPGTGKMKWQNACYSESRNCIFAYEADKGIFSLDCRRMSLTGICNFPVAQCFALLAVKNKLYIGGRKGLGVYDFETSSFSTIHGIDSPVYDLTSDKTGKIWIAAKGIFSIEDGVVRREDSYCQDLSNDICHDIDIDGDGNAWVAVLGAGLVSIQNGRTIIYNRQSTGFPINMLNTVTCFGNSKLVIGSEYGLSIFDYRNQSLTNYGESAGVLGNSTSGRSSIAISSESVWVGDNEGITEYSDNMESHSAAHTVTIDKVLVDGRPIAYQNDEIVLNHKQNSITFLLSDYDYNKSTPRQFECHFHSKQGANTPIDLSSPLSFHEMAIGKHIVTIRQKNFNSGEIIDKDIKIRIVPAWYECRAAKISYLLLGLLVAYSIIRSVRNKKELERKLRQSEIEKEKSTNFFIDLSYRIRTPLNIIIGMFGNYFKEYGHRSSGAEQLEEIYHNSIKIGELLASCIDSQEAIYDSTHIDIDQNRKNVRFINAATGIIEKHLFASEKIDVAALGREMHMGKTQLTSKFRDALGITPGKFIEDVKLKTAYSLLQDGSMLINEIATMLGFSSPGYFTVKFKEKYGVTPTAVEIRKE